MVGFSTEGVDVIVAFQFVSGVPTVTLLLVRFMLYIFVLYV